MFYGAIHSIIWWNMEKVRGVVFNKRAIYVIKGLGAFKYFPFHRVHGGLTACHSSAHTVGGNVIQTGTVSQLRTVALLCFLLQLDLESICCVLNTSDNIQVKKCRN